MSKYVKISTIGCSPVEVDPSSSLQEAVEEMAAQLEKKLALVLSEQPDLIVLPEMCDRPANYSRERRMAFFQVRGDTILTRFCDLANKHRCYLTYPHLAENEDGSWRNVIMLIDRDGVVVGTYQKNYPTLDEIEGDRVCRGRDAVVLNTDFGTVGLAICFDLNFDALRLKYAGMKPDMIIFSSMFHGGFMQQYWAYSCRSYLVSAISDSRPSQMVSPVGHVIRGNTNYFDYFTERINLDYAVCHLDNHWDKLEQMKKKYGSQVQLFDPGHLGSVLITSESEAFTAKDLLTEFSIETLDDYLARSSDFNTISI